MSEWEGGGGPPVPARGGTPGNGSADASEWGAVRPGAIEPLTLELVVEGTRGASPQELLGDPAAVQISGDRRARLHRRPADADAEQHPEDYQGGRPVTEVYSAGARAGDGPVRALWLLVLPFLLVNLAAWMGPGAPGGPHPRRTRAHGVLTRLLAAALTVQLFTAVVTVFMDLTVWQCALTSADCSREHPWIRRLDPADDGFVMTGPALAVGVFPGLLLIALLTRVGRRTWFRTEAVRPAPAPAGGSNDSGVPLAAPGMWYGRRQVLRLVAGHFTLALVTLTVPFLAVLLGSGVSPAGGSGAVGVAGAGVAGLAGFITLLTVLEIARAGRGTRLDERSLTRARWLPTAAIVLFLTAVALSWTVPGTDIPAGGHLPGVRPLSSAVPVVEVALVAGLFLCRPARSSRGSGRGVLLGCGGPVVALLACWLATVLSAVPAVATANLLGGRTAAGVEDIEGVPVFQHIAALGPLLLVYVALPLALAINALRRRTARRLHFEVERDYRGEAADRLRSEEITAARGSAALTGTAPLVLGLMGGAALVHLLLITFAVFDPVPARPGTETLTQVGVWLGAPLAALLVTAGWAAYTWPAARRSVGVLWDMSTFWPRAAHPFGPPCEAERAVPDLQWRMMSWMRATGGRLLLSGHGHGSVLAAAAAFQLEPRYRRRVSLLTSGSPLARIHGRWFPACFGPDQLRTLNDGLSGWRNLWRHTDPIGGPVGDLGGPTGDLGEAPVDGVPLRDPLAFGRTAEHPLYAPILGHDDYRADRVFATERALLLSRLRPRGPY
ncbi:hypothetical protein ACIBCM_10165 [Streptomyces sp. NPDC051018]|uniref:hypothetical protein n=1 Tax=Streptomyces sp. NPDC051018 TaxID=3365639 RepID=UPI0037B0A545